MRILLSWVLMAALSGVPAVGLVCDLLLCAEVTPASVACHEHDGAGSGPRVTASPEECTHLSTTGPYLVSAARLLFPSAASLAVVTVPAETAAFTRSGIPARVVHGPPGVLRVPVVVPLRI